MTRRFIGSSLTKINESVARNGRFPHANLFTTYRQSLPFPVTFLLMNLVTLQNATAHIGERTLLDKVSLLINDGDRIGLIGPNGSGKTTLLRIIAGQEPLANGSLTVWGNVRIQFLPQDPYIDPDLTVIEAVFQSDAPQMKLLQNYKQINWQLQQNPHDPDIQSRFADISAQMDQSHGWTAEAEAEIILTKLGITDFDAKISTLSGGQHKRVALAHALIDPADLLILDEPTNHIDAETIAWLEKHLEQRPGALLMVTHDRYFLDRIANRIIDLDRRQLINYPGNYSRYLELSAQRHEQLASAEQKRQQLLKRELEWVRRSPMARGTKQKARKQRVKELQKLSFDRRENQVALSLAGRRLGKRVLEARNLSKSFGDLTLFEHQDFDLNPGDRIGILGPNGTGKSTFLNVLAGKLLPDTGTVKWGETVVLGYYDQQSEGLRDDQRVFDYIADAAPLIKNAEGYRIDAAQMLEWFLFTRAEQQTYVGSLSGGERRRLYLLHTLVTQPNVLFLDEPTNDLDIQTLAVLEEFLDNFNGCLIVVSHDRYFLDRNVDFLIPFEDGIQGTRYPTPYESYMEKRENDERGMMNDKRKTKQSTGNSERRTDNGKRKKLTWKEKQELTAVTQRLAELETLIPELETAINNAGSDYVKLQELAAQLEAAKAELEEVEFRWLELAEKESQ
jgi:ATP-binding cassette subfamily F protein uup